MKKTRLFYPFAILLFGLVCVSFVSAQTVEIKNISGAKRKICMYKGDDKVGLVPYRCFEMNRDEKVLWNRGGDGSNFMVKIFEPKALLDDYLYTRHLPGDTTVILMGEGKRFGFGRDERKAPITKYRLKVCNQQWDQTVYFTLGFETNQVFVTEGWWNVAKGQCVEIGVSQRLKDNWNVEYGSLPRTFYYARTYGNEPLFWRGGENDYNLCINERDAFTIKQFEIDSAGQYQPLSCDNPGEDRVKFRRLDDPKTNQEYYYLTF
ncbi:MAG: DUF1036 domain-containing protein [Pyrinomonadaceae bacterium]